MSGLKRAVVAGVVCGCAATAWLAGHVRGTERELDGAAEVRGGRRLPSDTRKGVSRYLPWSFALDVRENAALARAERPDPYRGPRMTVTITVVDDAGQPVSGALVEARAYMEDYEIAGLTDDEYDAWAEASDAAARAEEEAAEAARAEVVDGEYEEPEEYEDAMVRVAVQSGRTDRKGTLQFELKPDAEVVFHAMAGKREGVSALFVTWTRDELENPAEEEVASGESDEEIGAEGWISSEGFGEEGYDRGPAAVTIEIAALAVLAGAVHDELGNPVANAHIDLAPLTTDGNDAYRDLEDLVVDVEGREAHHDGLLLLTAEDGSFRIPLRTYGAFDVTVEADGLRPATVYAVQLVPGSETTVSITMPIAAQLAGIVFDDRGEPLAQAAVQFTLRIPGGSRGWGTFTNADGSFALDGLESGEGQLRVNADGFVSREFERIATGEEGLVVRLERDTSVAVALAEEVMEPQVEPQDLGSLSNFQVTEHDGQQLGAIAVLVGDEEAFVEEPAEEPAEEPPEELFTPDVRIEPTNAGVIVLAARPSSSGRLYGGDRVLSIDGRTVDDVDGWDLVALLDGPKGSRCRIVVERPATQQTVAVDLERVVPINTY